MYDDFERRFTDDYSTNEVWEYPIEKYEEKYDKEKKKQEQQGGGDGKEKQKGKGDQQGEDEGDGGIINSPF